MGYNPNPQSQPQTLSRVAAELARDGFVRRRSGHGLQGAEGYRLFGAESYELFGAVGHELFGAEGCGLFEAAGCALFGAEGYRGTSLARRITPLGPYRRPMPRILGAS